MLPAPPLTTFVFLLSLTFHVMISNANLTPNFETYETHVQESDYSSKLLRPRRTSPYSLDGSLEISEPQKLAQSSVPSETTRQIEELLSTKILLEANTTIFSKNKTFQLGFFSPNGSRYYLGIWYSFISPPTYIWVANRERPIKNISSTTLEITETGRLAVKDSVSSIVWQSTNLEAGTALKLLENGNLVLLTSKGTVSWQSFDYPTDTWLPGMNLTTAKSLTSWRSSSDPSPGLYSLRLRPDYSEFELVFNGSMPYWSTGNWTGKAFSNVPEMLVPYIYRFHFDNPFMETASFGFAETPLDGLTPPLTRFQLHYSGQLRQNTWSAQVENWNMFWVEPSNTCLVFGTCGKFGLCDSLTERCNCLSGFEPVNKINWESSRDYSDGCRRVNDPVSCEEKTDDMFEQVGIASLGDSSDSEVDTFNSRLDLCQKACLENCTCVGVHYDVRTKLCKHLFGSLLNLRNSTSDNMDLEVVHVRVGKEGILKKRIRHLNPVVLAAIIVGLIAVLGFVMVGRGVTTDKWFFPPWAARQIIEGNVAAVIDHRLGRAYDVDEARRVALVAVWCIQDDEAIRPAMGAVVKMLEGLVEVTVPPPPKLLQALVSGESFHGVNADSGGGGGVPTGTSSDFSPENIRFSNAGSESSLGKTSSPVNANVNGPHDVRSNLCGAVMILRASKCILTFAFTSPVKATYLPMPHTASF
ncbi:hypothetical protein CsatA_020714 [Cannabis sativa]